MSRHYIHIFQWVERYYQEAANQFNLDKMLLVETFYQLRHSAETHPEIYLATMERGYLMAQQLGEPCWRFFYAYWRWEVLMLYMERQTEGLKFAIEMVVEARKPEYAHCITRSPLFAMLVDSYVLVDPIGYEDAIRETSRYVEDELPISHQTHCLLLRRRAELEYALGDLPTAIRQTEQLLDLAEKEPFQQMYAYEMLCHYHHLQGDRESARRYANTTYEISLNLARKSVIMLACAWQALFFRQDGDISTAQSWYQRAESYYQSLKMKAALWYFDILCEYHEIGGELEAAWTLRDRQLPTVIGTGGYHNEIVCRIKRASLLGRMGRAPDDEIAMARQIAPHLLRPDAYLAQLDRIAAGDDRV
ncbi:MAG: hypothetical protein MUF87_20430 [Anaerolineae bacterium]|jgi:tetratricopeptide (TPR) repeat protein|nr:hypothetical protein [Anaerolineae bacterium]